MELQNLDVRELNLREQQELEGGGILADAIAYVIGFYTCGCHRDYPQDPSMYM